MGVSIPTEELRRAPRVWARHENGARVRIIDPRWMRDAERRAKERSREEAAQRSIAPHLLEAYRRPISASAKILAGIALFHGVAVSDITGRSRKPKIVTARFHACFALRQAGKSYPQIGAMLKKDHTSVLYACRKWPEHAARLGLSIEDQPSRRAA